MDIHKTHVFSHAGVIGLFSLFQASDSLSLLKELPTPG